MKSSIRDTLNVIENGVCGNLLDTDIPLKPSTTTTTVSQSSQNEIKEDIQLSVVRPNSSDVSKENNKVSFKDLLGPVPSVVDESSSSKKNSDVHDEVWKRQLEETSKSYLFEYEKSLPKFIPSEVFVGDLLGKGGYASVYEIKSFCLCNDDESNDEDQRKSRNYLKARVDSHHDDNNRRNFCYAIKFLRKDVMDNKQLYQLAAADIALEAKLLCSLFHPNIIQLRGFCNDKLEGNYHHSLILDRLYETLDQRIVKWKQQEMNNHKNNKNNKGLQWNLFSVDDDDDIPSYKLNILFDITSALQYIHEMNIVYRDIKPTNFGFDAEGTIKLFDFGLAKDLSSSEKLKDGTYYNLTRAIGSQRYMAPEVYKGEPYNTTADIYSFSIMLWEILTMKKPYQGFNNEQHAKLVFYGTYRPDISTNAIPKSFQSMLESGWSSNLHKRPNFETIQNHISDLISSLRDDQTTKPPIHSFNFESLIMKVFAVIIAAIAVIIFDSSNIPFI